MAAVSNGRSVDGRSGEGRNGEGRSGGEDETEKAGTIECSASFAPAQANGAIRETRHKQSAES